MRSVRVGASDVSADPIDVEQPEPPDEETVVRWNRYKEARRAGLSIVEAQLFADSLIDVGLLRSCVANGWSGEQIRDVLL